MFYKQEIYDFLKEIGIWHEITEHKAVFNMEELDSVELAARLIRICVRSRLYG